MAYDSFKPGQVWKDTNGKPIQAHGFSVFYNEKDGLYYWYGENKEKTKGGLFNKVWHWGVRCYTSKDLYNWEVREICGMAQNHGRRSQSVHVSYAGR